MERRVDETAQALADTTMAGDSRASHHLSVAWGLAFGRDPDPTGAYREAVRAVEAALIPIVSPNNSQATLGTVIGEIDANPEAFSMRLQPSGQLESVDVLVRMIRLLWSSQLDRHGTSDDDAPLNVSASEAEDAVILAVALVRWAQSGAIAKRS